MSALAQIRVFMRVPCEKRFLYVFAYGHVCEPTDRCACLCACLCACAVCKKLSMRVTVFAYM